MTFVLLNQPSNYTTKQNKSPSHKIIGHFIEISKATIRECLYAHNFI